MPSPTKNAKTKPSKIKKPAKVVKTASSKADVRIVILQRGWVMIGLWSKKGTQEFLDNAMVIRRWGTKRGLGELINGRTPDTILDPAGHVEFHELTTIAKITCDASKWVETLAEQDPPPSLS